MAPTVADRPWFDPLVRKLERPAFQFALMMVRDRSAAEDIVQEAFARVWASPNTPSAEPEFRRWLYRAIQNLVRDHQRRRRRLSRLRFWAPPAADPLQVLDQWAEDRELIDQLRRLSVRERHAIYLHYYEDQTFETADQMLGTRPGTCRKIVSRAIEKLRRRLPADSAEGARI